MENSGSDLNNINDALLCKKNKCKYIMTNICINKSIKCTIPNKYSF